MATHSGRLIGFGRKTNSNLTVAAMAVTVTANTSNVNLFTLAGSPAGIVTVNCTINSGVYCYASTTGNYGFRTGAFAAGSTINIINNGFITGQGANGGVGMGWYVSATNGAAAGSAFLAEVDCNISGSGQVNGGGGGGGGGAASIDCGSIRSAGGGGGGGRSFLATNGGAGGPGPGCQPSGQNGGAGNVSGPGSGGAPAAGYPPGQSGGAGGGWGSAGTAGGNSCYPGGSGGAGGKSVVKNGKTVSITGVTTNGTITA